MYNHENHRTLITTVITETKIKCFSLSCQFYQFTIIPNNSVLHIILVNFILHIKVCVFYVVLYGIVLHQVISFYSFHDTQFTIFIRNLILKILIFNKQIYVYSFYAYLFYKFHYQLLHYPKKITVFSNIKTNINIYFKIYFYFL